MIFDDSNAFDEIEYKREDASGDIIGINQLSIEIAKILNGEIETGVTTFLIENKVDTGDILLQEHYKLDSNITSGEVLDDLAVIGAKLILSTLDHLSTNTLVAIQQEHNTATSAPKYYSNDLLIHWNTNYKIY